MISHSNMRLLWIVAIAVLLGVRALADPSADAQAELAAAMTELEAAKTEAADSTQAAIGQQAIIDGYDTALTLAEVQFGDRERAQQDLIRQLETASPRNHAAIDQANRDLDKITTDMQAKFQELSDRRREAETRIYAAEQAAARLEAATARVAAAEQALRQVSLDAAKKKAAATDKAVQELLASIPQPEQPQTPPPGTGSAPDDEIDRFLDQVDQELEALKKAQQQPPKAVVGGQSDPALAKQYQRAKELQTSYREAFQDYQKNPTKAAERQYLQAKSRFYKARDIYRKNVKARQQKTASTGGSAKKHVFTVKKLDRPPSVKQKTTRAVGTKTAQPAAPQFRDPIRFKRPPTRAERQAKRKQGQR